MDTVYLVCVIIGFTLLGCQLVLTFIGLGGDSADVDAEVDMDVDVDTDVDVDADGDTHHGHGDVGGGSAAWLWSLVSFRALLSGVTFFGIFGKIGSTSGMHPFATAIMAVSGGLGAMLVMAWLMRSIARLASDGTARVRRAKGSVGKVYLTIPANKTGTGRVQITLQNRTVELNAMTPADKLETGTKIKVVEVVSSDTVVVMPVGSKTA